MSIKLLYPSFLIIIFILLELAPVKSSLFGQFFPSIDLMLVYFWSIYRPEITKNWFLFLAGLLKDVISGTVIGINALLYLSMKGISLTRRESYSDQPFFVLWRGFIIIFFVVSAIKWAVFSSLAGHSLFTLNVFIQFLITVILYPIFHALFSSVSMTMPARARDA